MAAKKQLVYKVGEVGQDNLFAHVFPAARLVPVTIANAEGKLTRGAVLYADETGSFKHVDEENKAKARAILYEDVDATSAEVATFAYATGDFNIHAVNLKSIGKPDATVILAPQDHQIYLSELQD